MASNINELNSGTQQDLNYQQNFEFNNKGNEGPRGNESTKGNEFIDQNNEQNTKSDLLPRKRLRTHAHTSTTSGLASKLATVGTLAVGGIITTGALMVDVVKDYDVGDNYIVYELDFNQIDAPEFEIYIEDSETDEPILDSMKTVFKLDLGEDASYKDSYFGLEPDHKYYLIIDKVTFESPEGADPTGAPQDPIRVQENIKRFAFKTTYNKPILEIQSLKVGEYFSSEIFVLAEVIYSDLYEWITNPYLHYEITDYQGNKLEHYGQNEEQKIAITEYGLLSIPIIFYSEENVIISCYLSYEYRGREVTSDPVRLKVEIPPLLYAYYEQNQGIYIEVYHNINKENLFLRVKEVETKKIIKDVDIRQYLQKNPDLEYEIYFIGDLSLEKDVPYIFEVYGKNIYSTSEFVVYDKPTMRIEEMILAGAHQRYTDIYVDVFNYNYSGLITNAYLHYEIVDFQGRIIENYTYEQKVPITELGLHTIPLNLYLEQNVKVSCYLTYVLDGEQITTNKTSLVIYIGPLLEASYLPGLGLEIEVFENINNDPLSIEIVDQSGSTIRKGSIGAYLKENSYSNALAYYLIDDLDLVDGNIYNYTIYGRHTFYSGEFQYYIGPRLRVVDLEVEEVFGSEVMVAANIQFTNNNYLTSTPLLKYYAKNAEGNLVDIVPSGSALEIELSQPGEQTQYIYALVNENITLYCYIEYELHGYTFTTDEVSLELLQNPVISTQYLEGNGILVEVFENPNQEQLKVEITNSSDQIVWNQNITPYLVPGEPGQNMDTYIIDNLNLVSGETYNYRIYSRYTYYRGEFTYYKAPSIAISSLTAGELANDLSISAVISYQDLANVVTSATLIYYATDFYGYQIDVTLPGSQPEIPFTNLGPQTINFGIILNQNTKLHCYVEYVVGGNSYFTEEVVLDIYLPPAMEVHYEIFDGFIIEVFENPEATELFLEITNSSLQIVRNGSVSSYLTTTYPSSASEVYQINDLNLTSGQTYFYRIYGDYTYRRGNFIYYNAPNIGVTSLTPIEHDAGSLSINAAINVLDPNNLITGAILKYRATDFDGNPIDVYPSGSTPEVPLTNIGSQTLPFTIYISINTKLYCHIEYVVDGLTYETEEKLLNINYPPSLEVLFDPLSGLTVYIIDNTNQLELFLEIFDNNEESIWNKSLTPYLDPSGQGGPEIYVVDDLALESGIYNYRIYNQYTYQRGEFQFQQSPKITIDEVKPMVYTSNGTNVDVKVNYVDESGYYISNAYLHYYGTDLEGNPIDLGAPSSSIAIASPGAQTITLTLNIVQNIKLYCYVTYEINYETITTETVETIINARPNMESYYTIMDGIRVLVFGNPNQEVFFVEIYDIMDAQVVWNQNISSYLTPNPGGDTEEYYVINDLAIAEDKVYMYRVYGTYTFYESEFTFNKPPTAQVNSITASEYIGGEVEVLVEINYVDTYNVATNPVLKFYGTDFDGAPIDLGAVASSIPIEGQGVQTITLSLGLVANIKLYCYIEYNVNYVAYESSHAMGEIYLPAMIEGWMDGLDLVVLEIDNPRNEELFIEIKDIDGNVVRSESIASYYVPNYLDHQGAYIINDLNLEINQEYTYIIYGGYIYYRSSLYYGV